MANWPSKTCGNCGTIPENDAELPKYVCPKCEREMCNYCAGGNDNTPLCKDCGFAELRGRSVPSTAPQFPEQQP